MFKSFFITRSVERTEFVSNYITQINALYKDYLNSNGIIREQELAADIHQATQAALKEFLRFDLTNSAVTCKFFKRYISIAQYKKELHAILTWAENCIIMCPNQDGHGAHVQDDNTRLRLQDNISAVYNEWRKEIDLSIEHYPNIPCVEASQKNHEIAGVKLARDVAELLRLNIYLTTALGDNKNTCLLHENPRLNFTEIKYYLNVIVGIINDNPQQLQTNYDVLNIIMEKISQVKAIYWHEWVKAKDENLIKALEIELTSYGERKLHSHKLGRIGDFEQNAHRAIINIIQEDIIDSDKVFPAELKGFVNSVTAAPTAFILNTVVNPSLRQVDIVFLGSEVYALNSAPWSKGVIFNVDGHKFHSFPGVGSTFAPEKGIPNRKTIVRNACLVNTNDINKPWYIIDIINLDDPRLKEKIFCAIAPEALMYTAFMYYYYYASQLEKSYQVIEAAEVVAQSVLRDFDCAPDKLLDAMQEELLACQKKTEELEFLNTFINSQAHTLPNIDFAQLTAAMTAMQTLARELAELQHSIQESLNSHDQCKGRLAVLKASNEKLLVQVLQVLNIPAFNYVRNEIETLTETFKNQWDHYHNAYLKNLQRQQELLSCLMQKFTALNIAPNPSACALQVSQQRILLSSMVDFKLMLASSSVKNMLRELLANNDIMLNYFKHLSDDSASFRVYAEVRIKAYQDTLNRHLSLVFAWYDKNQGIESILRVSQYSLEELQHFTKYKAYLEADLLQQQYLIQDLQVKKLEWSEDIAAPREYYTPYLHTQSVRHKWKQAANYSSSHNREIDNAEMNDSKPKRCFFSFNGTVFYES